MVCPISLKMILIYFSVKKKQKKKLFMKGIMTTYKVSITKTRLFKYIENFTIKKMKIFR